MIETYRKEVIHINDEIIHLYDCTSVIADYDTNDRRREEYKIFWFNGKVCLSERTYYRSLGYMRSYMRPYDPVEENMEAILLGYFFNLMLCHPRIKSSCQQVHFPGRQ